MNCHHAPPTPWCYHQVCYVRLLYGRKVAGVLPPTCSAQSRTLTTDRVECAPPEQNRRRYAEGPSFLLRENSPPQSREHRIPPRQTWRGLSSPSVSSRAHPELHRRYPPYTGKNWRNRVGC